MQLFDSAKMYLFLFCVLAFITVGMLHQLTQNVAHVGATGFGINELLVAIGTLFMAAYLPILFRKITNRIDRAGIVLTEVLCVLWFANLLAELGVAWADIPHRLLVKMVVLCVITVLAGIRTFQVLWHRNLGLRSHG